VTYLKLLLRFTKSVCNSLELQWEKKKTCFGMIDVFALGILCVPMQTSKVLSKHIGE